MKEIRETIVKELMKGFCTPQLGKLSKKTKQAVTTLQYNIKNLEKENIIKTYKAVFDYKKINRGHCSFLFIDLAANTYSDPEEIARKLAVYDEVESVDICTGDYGLLLKIRTEDISSYYEFIKILLKNTQVGKTSTVTSLKQIKSEFIINS